MKKGLQAALISTLLVSAADARTHSNKTFLRSRPVLRNMAMQKATWHKQVNRKADGKFGGSIQVTGFYQESENRKGLGRYFGAHNPECTKCITKCEDCRPACGGCNDCQLCCKSPEEEESTRSCDPCDPGCNPCAIAAIQVDNTRNAASEDLVDLASFDILHNPSAASGAANSSTSAIQNQFFAVNPGGTIELRPRYSAWGFRFDYYQDLDKLTNGLYFRISTAVSEVETCMNPCLCKGDTIREIKVDDNGSDFSPGTAFIQTPDGNLENVRSATFSFGDNNGRTLLDYFSGCISQKTNPLTEFDPHGDILVPQLPTELIQDSLNKLRIPCDCDSTTELADIELVIGYNILDLEGKHVGLNVGVVFPTGNSADSCRLFEAISGNGDHWAFGAGFDTSFRLWQDANFSMDLTLALDYRYLFESNERRVVGFKDSENKPVNHGWYRLFGQVGETKVFPGANVLCCDVDVEPGSQVDFLAAIALNWGGWTIDLGYNLFAQESEGVCFGNKCCWRDNTYGLIDDNYDPVAFGAISIATDGTIERFENNKAINRADLCVEVAETPSQVTHKAYGGVGYATHMWNYPFMIGFGASYEWAESNSALEQWSVWGKLGVSF